jgi:hypothetical protein
MERNHLDDQTDLFGAAMVVGGLLMVASFFLTGPLAIAACLAGGSLLGLAVATAVRIGHHDGGLPPSPWPRRERVEPAAEPDLVIAVQADDAPSACRWCEQVERAAEPRAAGRNR